jgi:hypothetical protein
MLVCDLGFEACLPAGRFEIFLEPGTWNLVFLTGNGKTGNW